MHHYILGQSVHFVGAGRCHACGRAIKQDQKFYLLTFTDHPSYRLSLDLCSTKCVMDTAETNNAARVEAVTP